MKSEMTLLNPKKMEKKGKKERSFQLYPTHGNKRKGEKKREKKRGREGWLKMTQGIEKKKKESTGKPISQGGGGEKRKKNAFFRKTNREGKKRRRRKRGRPAERRPWKKGPVLGMLEKRSYQDLWERQKSSSFIPCSKVFLASMKILP